MHHAYSIFCLKLLAKNVGSKTYLYIIVAIIYLIRHYLISKMHSQSFIIMIWFLIHVYRFVMTCQRWLLCWLNFTSHTHRIECSILKRQIFLYAILDSKLFGILKGSPLICLRHHLLSIELWSNYCAPLLSRNVDAYSFILYCILLNIKGL